MIVVRLADLIPLEARPDRTRPVAEPARPVRFAVQNVKAGELRTLQDDPTLLMKRYAKPV
jgi:hypothetical protein